MSWKDFENAYPDLASLGFEKLNKKICYLALTEKDGSPRVHPVTPFIGSGMLFMFTEPSSPKIRDLRHDGRYALHCSVGREGPLVEFLVSGNARLITDPLVRQQAELIASSPVVVESYALFEFYIAHVLAVEYDEAKQKIIHCWHSD